MQHWHGPCSACARVGSAALTVTYRGRPVAGVCSACATVPDNISPLVAFAETFRAGADPEGARTVRIRRHDGVRNGASPVLFARLVPATLRAPEYTEQDAPRARLAATQTQNAPHAVSGATPRVGLWPRLWRWLRGA